MTCCLVSWKSQAIQLRPIPLKKMSERSVLCARFRFAKPSPGFARRLIWLLADDQAVGSGVEGNSGPSCSIRTKAFIAAISQTMSSFTFSYP